MNRQQLIKKTIENKRGYKYNSYETEYENDVFSLYHYGTKILEINLKENKVKTFRVFSRSDKDMINIALHTLFQINNKYNYIILKDKLYKIEKIKINDVKLTILLDYEKEDKLNDVIKILSKLNSHELEILNDMSWYSLAKTINELILNDEMSIETKIKKIRIKIKTKQKTMWYYETLNNILYDDKEHTILENAILIKIKKDYFFNYYIIPLLDAKIYTKSFLTSSDFKRFSIKFDGLIEITDLDSEDLSYIKHVLNKVNVYHKDIILKNIMLNKILKGGGEL